MCSNWWKTQNNVKKFHYCKTLPTWASQRKSGIQNCGKNIIIEDCSILECYALPLVDKLTAFRRVLVTLCPGTSIPRRVGCSEVRELKLKALQSSETSVDIRTNIYGVKMSEYLSLTWFVCYEIKTVKDIVPYIKRIWDFHRNNSVKNHQVSQHHTSISYLTE